MNIRNETWIGHSIRFVEINPGEWWGVAKDIACALDYTDAQAMTRRIKDAYTKTANLSVQGQKRKSIILSEFGIYKAIFNSHKSEAEAFQEWVFQMLKTLRQASGLEGFEVFRTLDKGHQKEAMQRLRRSISHPVRVDFIKANVIANKAVSTKYGYPKMVKKPNMTPQMLVDREPILDDTVNLMSTVKKFNLDVSVSDTIYKKHSKGLI